MFHTQWNTGDEIWFYTAIIIGAICLICIGGGLIAWARDKDGDGNGLVAAFVAACVGVVVAAVSAFVFFPFSSVYFQYRPVTGVVQNTPPSRFLSDGQGTTQNYLIQINGQQYRGDDTRFAGVHKGEVITMMCEKNWAANGASGYVCNWGKVGPNN